ncbi:MAG: DUF4147 domain-containing protein [Gemmatimonadetes bacterium]|nr:DUF4147 domain-containing protein [Gemmatimonadota bacterium]MCC6770468.1 DUF4147 domain-containing protein [Gemmatimonadaceae bacterium]
MTTPRLVADQLFRAAVRGADPYAATLAALKGQSLGARTWVVAVGKGAIPMARAALDALGAGQRSAQGGIVITSESPTQLGPLTILTGDHPVPGDGSLAAAQGLADVVSLVRPGDDVLILVSGGASSLMAAPVEGVSFAAMLALFQGLHRAGTPIDVMNAFRKRVMRWGAGRLAMALTTARVTCLIASDVIGDDPASIASGPCTGDRWRAGDLVALAQSHNLWPHVPDEVRRLLDAILSGDVAETPKPGTEALAHVQSRVILGNRDALEGIAGAGAELEIAVRIAPTPVTGRARSTGEAIAHAAVTARGREVNHPQTAPCRLALVWGGETTVSLAGGSHGTGGRAQELALAAARTLHEAGARGRGITILSAGTDGRDGPTDAAGAIIDATTWSRIALAGVDPQRALDAHDAYPALDAVGALLRTGMTGTNVNDVVIALVD